MHSFRLRSGVIGAGAFSLLFAGLTVSKGPRLESEYMRYALAGTVATVSMEMLTHAVDTINMRSKVINGPKFFVLNVFKLQGFLSLFNGLQAVVYGYTFAGFLYFYAYAALKDEIAERFYSEKRQNPSLLQTFTTSFVAGTVSECLALCFYYPFDLIKTRMQTTNEIYKYHNVTDAFYKLSSQPL